MNNFWLAAYIIKGVTVHWELWRLVFNIIHTPKYLHSVLIKRLLLFKFLFFKVLNILDPGVCFLRSTTLLIKYPDSHSDSLIIFKLMSGRGKFTLGVLLKTNYERGSVFKLFTRGVCSSTDAVRGTGDIGVPPLQMARSMLSWRVPPAAQARYTMLECRQCKWRYAVNYYNIYYKHLLITLLFHFQTVDSLKHFL